MAFKLHKFGFDLLKVVFDCVDLGQHALVKIIRSLCPVLVRPLDLSVEFNSVFVSLSKLSKILEIPLVLCKFSRAVLSRDVPWDVP